MQGNLVCAANQTPAVARGPGTTTDRQFQFEFTLASIRTDVLGEQFGNGFGLGTSETACEILGQERIALGAGVGDRKSTRLNSSHANIPYAVFCLKKKKNI